MLKISLLKTLKLKHLKKFYRNIHKLSISTKTGKTRIQFDEVPWNCCKSGANRGHGLPLAANVLVDQTVLRSQSQCSYLTWCMTPGDQKVLNQWARSNSWATKNHKFWKKGILYIGSATSPSFAENLHSFQSPRHPILLDGPPAVNATAHLALENAVFVAAQGDIAWAA